MGRGIMLVRRLSAACPPRRMLVLLLAEFPTVSNWPRSGQANAAIDLVSFVTLRSSWGLWFPAVKFSTHHKDHLADAK